MPWTDARWAAALVLAALLVPPIAAAPSGRPVTTQTIVVPQAPDDPFTFGGDSGGRTATGTVEPDAADAAESASAGALPTVEYDPAKLPPPVRRLREQILEAATSGDPEKLRPIVEAQDEPPAFSFNDIDDPIAYLKSLSGDPEGREILAILIEVLEAGYVHVDVGEPDEMYVWPYFARYPIAQLTGPQIVELLKIVFAGEYDDMKSDGNYFFFRAGIAPDGTWKYFLAGD